MNESKSRTLVGVAAGACIIAALATIYIVFFRVGLHTVAPAIPPVAPPKQTTYGNLTPPAVTFTDITESAGITFKHTNGMNGLKLLPETMGSGCAFIDFDGDGNPDIVFINSCFWSDDSRSSSQPTIQLFKNDGKGHFTDVTAEVGLDVSLFGMGVAVGDYDNDGFPDLFVTAVAGNRLFHNEGGKRFRDVTAGDLAKHVGWGTGAAFFDANNDGKLDLFVCNYVTWNREIDLAQDFRLNGTTRAFGRPDAFVGSFCQLLLGDGTANFVDVSKQAGIQKANPNTGAPMGKSLGVVACDLDQDGWMDVLVANDTVQNFFFHNKGGGVFEEIGAESGIAFDSGGKARGAMGIDVATYRDDGKVGIAIGNFANEMIAFYVNQDRSHLLFADRAVAEGIGPPSQLLLKFGLVFLDYDLDGRPDVLTANGHLEEDIAQVQASQTYAQPPQLFRNCGSDQRFVFMPVGAEHAGTDLFQPLVGRGLAYADIDGDGDLDLLITGNGGPPRLLRNNGGNKNRWLRVQLEGDGVRSNRSAIGTRVEIKVGDTMQRQELMGGRSYLSQPELVLTFGLGSAVKVDALIVTWPGGGIERLTDVPSNQVLRIKQAEVASESPASSSASLK